MNYGKKGVRAKQKALNSKSQKWGRKLALTCVKIGRIVRHQVVDDVRCFLIRQGRDDLLLIVHI